MGDQNENRLVHREMIAKINSALNIKDLPKVGLSELTKKILRAVNANSFKKDFKASDLKELTEAYILNKSIADKEKIIKKLVEATSFSDDDQQKMRTQIADSLFDDVSINYVVDEISAKEARKLQIYKIKHEETMDIISKANRISELPQGLTSSLINKYLNGNTTIYSNDNRITTEDLRTITNLLIEGHKWEDEEIKQEVKRISTEKYPEKEDAYELLFKKLSKLPRTYYYVEEINYSQKRQTEFIGRGSSNVNVYFVPNSKSPSEGGRFYNCYINRVGQLDLSKILPLNLDDIVSPDTDIDEVEEIVKKVDPTFKAAGAIILNKDETIGDVSIFRPNDGKVGVSPEEKERMDKIDNLDSQINEKQNLSTSLDKEINEKTKISHDIEAKMRQALLDYEKKALELQMEFMKNISELKAEAGLENQSPEGKGLK